MKKQNFLKGSLILMISAVTAKALGALFKIPLTNMLGGVGMSYFSCAYSIFMPVYALTVTGLSAAVARMTAQSAALGRYKNAAKIRRTALALFSAAGLAGSFIVAIASRPVSMWSAGNYQAAPAVTMIAPAVLFGCIAAVGRGYYEGMSNMYPTAFSQVIEGAVKVCAGLILCSHVYNNGEKYFEYFPAVKDIRALAAAAGITGVTLSTAGAAVYFAVMRIFSHERYVSGDETVSSVREISSELVRTAFPTGISAVITNLTALIDMRTVIAGISYDSSAYKPEGISPAEFPHFVYGSFAGIALTVFNLVPSVTNMLGRGVLPCITEAWAGNRKDLLRSRTMQALFTAAMISAPAAAGIAALSPEILGTLFPAQSDEVRICISSLRYLMPGMVCLCLSYPVSSMLQAVGKPAVPLYIMLAGTLFKLIGNLILIPKTGIDGAAVSTSLSYMLILAVSLVCYLKTADIKLNFRAFLPVLYSGIMCGAGAYLAAGIFSRRVHGNIIPLCIAVSAGGILYIISLLISGGDMIISWVKKKPAKKQA